MKITKQTAPPVEVTVLSIERDPRGGNPQTHGILSAHVPASEREAFAAHALAVRQSSGAQGYLQERLADRAALAFWRLDRVARWEAVALEAQQRRFQDGLSSPDPVYDALRQLNPAPLSALNLRDSLKALSELTGEAGHAFLSDPECAESYAQDSEREALGWAALTDGADVAALPAEVRESLGFDLLSALPETWDVDPAHVARAMLGRKPTRDEVQAVADCNWTVEPGELPRLITEAARAAGAGWQPWLLRKQHEVGITAAKVRVIAARLPMLLEQEQAQASEPDSRRLEKITRYEAHLERVLYRALHELEVARRERQGQDTPAPLRVVLDERAEG